MLYWLLPLTGYLIGSLSSAILVSRLLRLPDPRKSGSLNPGTTNVLRLGSKIGAALTLLGDIAKGFVPILAINNWISDDPILLATLGIGAFIGHIFPIYFKFIGGKGVATALGIFLAINPLVASIQIITWLIVVIILRYSSLAAIVTAMATPIYFWWFDNEMSLIVFSAFISILLLFRHKKNIKHLVEKTEPKIQFDR
jgi:glycerol-3-phosphate acyltransferase PlsY